MTPCRPVLALVAAATIAAAVLPGCSRGKVTGEGRLEPDGRVVLTRDDKPATVAGSRALVKGDTVEVIEGTAKITLPGGHELELGSSSLMVLSGGPDLRTGSALVTTDEGFRTVRAAGTQIDASGAARIDVTLGLRIASYGGRSVVRSGGATLEVPALREAFVPVISVLRGPQPLGFDAADPWDLRFLGQAASRKAELEDLADGFGRQVSPANATSLSYYRGAFPELSGEAGFGQAEIERLGRTPADGAAATGADRFRAGEVLLGAAIAVQGRRGTFTQRLKDATAFRAEGAAWSLVALDQQVPSIDDLIRRIDGAVNAVALELAAPATRNSTSPPVPDPVPPARTASTTRSASARGTATTTTTTTTRPRTGTATTTAPPQRQPQQQPQTPPPVVLPVDPLLDAAVDPVADLLNNLLGTPRR